MYINTVINCGFMHHFNNDSELTKLLQLIKENPDAKFNFELSHLGRKSENFVFEIEHVEDDEYGYYIRTYFTVNAKRLVSWDDQDEDVPWGAIWSTLYDILVSLRRYGYELEETP